MIPYAVCELTPSNRHVSDATSHRYNAGVAHGGGKVVAARTTEQEWYRLNAHRRLLLSLMVALVVAFLTPESARIPVRLAFSWDIGVIAFLAMTWRVVQICPTEQMRETVLANDQGRVGGLVLVLLS